MGAALSDGIVAFAGVPGAVDGDAAGFLLRRDLAQKVEAHAGCASHRLTHLFATRIGGSYNDYVKGCRIRKARARLRGTGATALEISLDVGFNTRSTIVAWAVRSSRTKTFAGILVQPDQSRSNRWFIPARRLVFEMAAASHQGAAASVLNIEDVAALNASSLPIPIRNPWNHALHQPQKS